MPAVAAAPDHARARGGRTDEGGCSACSGEWRAVHAHVEADGGREVKFIWWFASGRTGEDKVEGTQTAVESFTSWFVDVEEVLQMAIFQEDRGDREGCRACARDVSRGERESGKVGYLVW